MLVSDPIGSIFSKLQNIKERTGTGGHTVIHRSSRAHNLSSLLICESIRNKNRNVWRQRWEYVEMEAVICRDRDSNM
jgi:hypothetical protein